MAAQLTVDELTFVKRMVPHIEAGKTFEEAAKAVLADDERIYSAFYDRGTSQYVPTPDERGRSYHTGNRTGDLIRSELSATVYERLRAAA